MQKLKNYFESSDGKQSISYQIQIPDIEFSELCYKNSFDGLTEFAARTRPLQNGISLSLTTRRGFRFTDEMRIVVDNRSTLTGIKVSNVIDWRDPTDLFNSTLIPGNFLDC
jgi:hypothetical protein